MHYCARPSSTECLVVAEKESCEDIKAALQEVPGLVISVVWVAMQDCDQESMESLRQVRPLLRAASVLLLSCDLVCDVPLHLLADVHRSNNAAVTVLLGWAGPPRGEGAQEEEGRRWQPPGGWGLLHAQQGWRGKEVLGSLRLPFIVQTANRYVASPV